MKVLVVGSGGREHALVEHFADNGRHRVYAHPGSDRIFETARPIDVEAVEQLPEAARREKVELIVVGPERYLAEGLADECERRGLFCWGPVEESARLETSKWFAKRFMNRHGIPTARFEVAHAPDEIRNGITGFPAVLKYDGLAAGKGVSICRNHEDVEQYIHQVFEQRRFGSPGPVLIEEKLEGPECSVICAVDDGDFFPFPPARDYKRLLDGDRGPNTGGMGAVAHPELLSAPDWGKVRETIVQPTLDGLNEEGLSYRGFLFFGLMLTANGPRLLEYNCRFGDPEAQAILPLVEGDLARVLREGLQPDPRVAGRLDLRREWSVCLMTAAEGYPRDSADGVPIRGLENLSGASVFHSGTRFEDGTYCADGGRVLSVVERNRSREEAVKAVYRRVEELDFEGMQYRNDVGRHQFENSAVASSR